MVKCILRLCPGGIELNRSPCLKMLFKLGLLVLGAVLGAVIGDRCTEAFATDVEGAMVLEPASILTSSNSLSSFSIVFII